MIVMLRRVTALLAMLTLLGLLLFLMWTVYVHHQRGSGEREISLSPWSGGLQRAVT